MKRMHYAAISNTAREKIITVQVAKLAAQQAAQQAAKNAGIKA